MSRYTPGVFKIVILETVGASSTFQMYNIGMIATRVFHRDLSIPENILVSAREPLPTLVLN